MTLAPPSRTAVIAELLDEMIARVQAGAAADIDAWIANYPEHAEELKRLAPAVVLMAQLSQTSDQPNSLSNEHVLDGTLGDFRLIREVGRGGMGIVYEATQISLNRRVALKILPFAATMDPRQLQRFRHEAQAAAMLHHPNIVPVHGVGCERGVHYYAMQLIDGITLANVVEEFREPKNNDEGRFKNKNYECRITKDQGTIDHPPRVDNDDSVESPMDTDSGRRNVTSNVLSSLDISHSSSKRTQYFRRIAHLIAHAADALEYAHSMGVVHRDIKPGNLLLDDLGHLWVADFGLAKLETNANMTMTGDLVGTLKYMSPEQALARHGLVDHRTDVYSLGATLYELLTLRPAVDGADKQEILKKIAFEEPVALRKIDKSIPVELETITLKCLAKNPNERYATAKEVGDDLRRWLSDQTIRARPPGLGERVTKWARRHRPMVASAFAVLSLTVVGLSVGTVLILKEKARTEEHFVTARQAVDEMYTEVAEEWLNDAPMLTDLQEKFLGKALKFYERYGIEYGRDPSLSYEVARAFMRVGRIQMKLGRNVEAETAFSEAITRFQALSTAFPIEARYSASLAMAYLSLASLLEYAIRYEDAATAANSAIEIQRRLVVNAPELPGHWPDLAASYHRLGSSLALRDRASREEAERAQVQALEIQTRLVDAFPENSSYQSELGRTLNDLARKKANSSEAQEMILKAIHHQQVAVTADPRRFQPRDFLSKHYYSYGEILTRFNRFDEAERVFQTSISQTQRLLEDFPNFPELHIRVFGIWEVRCPMFAKAGRGKEAIEAACTARDLGRAFIDRFPEGAGHQFRLATHLTKLADVVRDLDDQIRPAGLEMELRGLVQSAYRNAARAYEQLIVQFPDNPGPLSNLSSTLSNLANTLTKMGENSSEIPELVRRAIEYERQAIKARPSCLAYHQNMCIHHNHLNVLAKQKTDSLVRAGRYSEADKLCKDIRDRHEALVAEYPDQSIYRLVLGNTYIQIGNVYRAMGYHADELTAWRGAVKNLPNVAGPFNFLGKALIQAGQTEEGLEAIRRSIQLDPNYAQGHCDFGLSLLNLGRTQEAVAPLQRAVELRPKDAFALCGLGTAFGKLGRPKDGEPFLRRAIAQQPGMFHAHHTLGIVLIDTRRPTEALEFLIQAKDLNPDDAMVHWNLGRAFQTLGRFQDALESFRRGHALGSRSANWNLRSAETIRSIEQLIALDEKLPAILAGETPTENPSETISVALLCHEQKGLNRTAVRFYADAFAADAKLADNVRAQHRYNAACAAVLAASGQGKDAVDLDEANRLQLRHQALDWLTADLAEWIKLGRILSNRPIMLQALQHWQQDSDLFGVRDKTALEKLSALEREKWSKFWADVSVALAHVQATNIPKEKAEVIP